MAQSQSEQIHRNGVRHDSCDVVYLIAEVCRCCKIHIVAQSFRLVAFGRAQSKEGADVR